MILQRRRTTTKTRHFFPPFSFWETVAVAAWAQRDHVLTVVWGAHHLSILNPPHPHLTMLMSPHVPTASMATAEKQGMPVTETWLKFQVQCETGCKGLFTFDVINLVSLSLFYLSTIRAKLNMKANVYLTGLIFCADKLVRSLYGSCTVPAHDCLVKAAGFALCQSILSSSIHQPSGHKNISVFEEWYE